MSTNNKVVAIQMSTNNICFCKENQKLEAQVGQKSLTWIR